jgi:hypothetical protein
MKTRAYQQTMAQTYRAICQGETPWVALGNFMNAWFDYASDQRASLVTDPLMLPDEPDTNTLRWATFCAASVEWLCERYGIACPSWVEKPIYALPEPWYDSPAACVRQVRERLRSQTPAPSPGAMSIAAIGYLPTSMNLQRTTRAIPLPTPEYRDLQTIPTHQPLLSTSASSCSPILRKTFSFDLMESYHHYIAEGMSWFAR